MIREVNREDLPSLLQLYTQLHDNPIPDDSEYPDNLWNDILLDKNHHIIVCSTDEKIVSSCVCVIIPNLTHSQRPYALIENVVTDKEYRGHGYATACLDYAQKIAENNNCYKMMLMTGSKLDSTLDFYRRAGYNDNDKTAFIKWL